MCSFHKKNGALPLSEMSICNGTDIEGCHQERAFVSSHHCLPSQHIGFPSPALDERSDKSHRSAGSCQTLERSHFQTFSSLVQSHNKTSISSRASPHLLSGSHPPPFCPGLQSKTQKQAGDRVYPCLTLPLPPSSPLSSPNSLCCPDLSRMRAEAISFIFEGAKRV